MPSRPDWKSFGLGFGLAFLAGSVLPTKGLNLRPAAKGVIRGVILASERIRVLSEEIQSEIEDMVAEVEYERMSGETQRYEERGLVSEEGTVPERTIE